MKREERESREEKMCVTFTLVLFKIKVINLLQVFSNYKKHNNKRIGSLKEMNLEEGMFNIITYSIFISILGMFEFFRDFLLLRVLLLVYFVSL